MNSKQFKERLIKYSLFICAAFSTFVVAFIFVFLANSSWPAVLGFFTNGLSWFNQGGFNSEAGHSFVILTNIDTTVYLAVGATVLAVIFGLPCAIYMAEFSDMKLRNFTKTTMEVLDGFPSIVIGIIGFTILAEPKNSYTFSGFLHSQAGGILGGGCDLYAWLILMLMAFPVIATISEDALRAVPQELREASLGLGATRLETTRKFCFQAQGPE